MANRELQLRPAARLENEHGNNANVEERGEHEHHRLTYSRFKLLVSENGGRRCKFDDDVDFGRTGG
jgi:hypothetical protein